ncbi:MAG: hypothetical protein HOQ41_20030, partial [Ensifer adhaerens]|nr:hypothetical protein [Ensifer adhaerens]
MPHYLTELYSAKPAWLALPRQGRQQFLAAIGSAMPGLTALGVELITFGQVDQS